MRGAQAGAHRAPLGSARPRATWSGPRTDLREDIVDADDAVRAGGAAVVHDGGVALHPHPAAVLGQEAVVLGGHLPFHQHCGEKAGRGLSAAAACGVMGPGKWAHTLQTPLGEERDWEPLSLTSGSSMGLNPRGQGWWAPQARPISFRESRTTGYPSLFGEAG